MSQRERQFHGQVTVTHSIHANDDVENYNNNAFISIAQNELFSAALTAVQTNTS